MTEKELIGSPDDLITLRCEYIFDENIGRWLDTRTRKEWVEYFLRAKEASERLMKLSVDSGLSERAINSYKNRIKEKEDAIEHILHMKSDEEIGMDNQ